MKVIRVSRNTYEYFLLYTIAILVIILSGSVPVSLANGVALTRILSFTLIFISAIYIVRALINKRWVRSFVLSVLVLGMYWLINYIRYSESGFNLLIRFAWFITLFIMCKYVKFRGLDFEKCLYHIILILSMIAFAFFIIINFVDLSLPYTTVNNEGFIYYNYFGCFYVSPTYYVRFLGILIYRMQSIFWEPGVFAVILNFAIYYFVFIDKKKKKLQLFVLLFDLLFTASTTGICVGICLVAVYFYRSRIIKSLRLIISLPVVLIAFRIVYVVWTAKKAATSYHMGSYFLRANDIIVGLKLFASHFLIGVGYRNTKAFELAQGLGRGSSNGLITWFYTMGIVGVVLVMYPFIKNILLTKKIKDKIELGIFFLLFLILNMTEPIYSAPIMVYYVAREYTKSFY
ncbi:hypothetical protein [Lacrimispora sp.]|jgi:hypothetical protein|uniref:hypothetical protein n=1 Tax=Lacrimispora sp. TaxID=2719234 RepID=UPI0028ADD434|nr:hypothetical protein [Lacrimispora sp.]